MRETPLRKTVRLAVDAALSAGSMLTLSGNAAHYLTHVLRLGVGERVAVFNHTDGEWQAMLAEISKKHVTLTVQALRRAPSVPLPLTVCFAPVKGGRLETIIEKATELGAAMLQPVITQRTIVDKVNLERAEAIAREAAEQCERGDWPEIRAPRKLLSLLSDWPLEVPLLYGDESGASGSIQALLLPGGIAKPTAWGILTGPEGGFTPEEFQALSRLKAARGVGLGPRILRADTAVITLCAATGMAWGDWAERPRFGA